MASSSSSSASCSSLSFKYLKQKHQLFPCKYNPSTFNLWLILSPPKHTPELVFARENVVSRFVVAKLSPTDHEKPLSKTPGSRPSRETRLGFRDDRVGRRYEKKQERNGDGRNREVGIGEKSSVRPRDKSSGSGGAGNVKRNGKQVGEEKEKEKEKGKGSKKIKDDSPEFHLRVGLDMCSKRGDVKKAIEFFDLALREGTSLGQYHYTVLLYLCSSAAVGVVRPAKSGSASRSLDALEPSDEVSSSSSAGLDGEDSDVSGLDDDSFDEKEKINWFCNSLVKRSYRLLDGLGQPSAEKGDGDVCDDASSSDMKNETRNNEEDRTIRVDEDLKEYARKRGFEIFEKMRLDKVPMNEAALTSVARMAMSTGDGDTAFDTVKQMKSLGINPRLRSYGPALSAFCSRGDVEKAFSVEAHMLENGVYPEEPELQALLRLSVGVGMGDKVYYLLQKLRASVRKVSTTTADLIVDWFNGKAASRVGKTKWDERAVKKAVADGGGGWHGQGWLGRGKWSVVQTSVGTEGLCQCCGEKLAIIDLDSKETEEFAESVASIAIEREKHSNFQKFQKWLDYYGPFEAVVDGANVGLFSQKRFMPSKINTVVNGIRQKLPSKKWPLVVLHNRRLIGPKMNETFNRALLDKWRNADAIYPTPTGSNDDWYWLYAAIKFKSFLVTNDEMRDHTFQLLGNDYFPIWKERHQVRFSFSDAGLEFHMPPPCSVVIQESEQGHWHIPISLEYEHEAERPWLCIMRAKSRVYHQDPKPQAKGSGIEAKTQPLGGENQEQKSGETEKIYKNLRDILSESMISDGHSIVPKIEDAEKLGACTIDFQI